MTTFAVFLMCYLGVLAAMIIAMTTSEKGYEDERGFHLGEEDGAEPSPSEKAEDATQPRVAEIAPSSC